MVQNRKILDILSFLWYNIDTEKTGDFPAERTILMTSTAKQIQLDTPAVNIEISSYRDEHRTAPIPRGSNTTSRGVKKATAADPIRDPAKINELADFYLHNAKTHRLGLRNRMAFIIGVTTGLRVSDILKLKIGDVVRPNGEFITHLTVREKKTGKTNDPKLGVAARKAIAEYLEDLNGEFSFDDYLIRSSKGGKLTVTQFYRIINAAESALGLTDHISTHSMRKTYGYQTIRQNPDDSLAVVHLQGMFNHSSMQTTLTYCGISRDEEDKYYDGINELIK